MITLFWCPRTRASRILWLLEELGQPFHVRTIDIRNADGRNDPDFLAASPMGKVPAIMDTTPRGVVHVSDSAAIALYLADRYPGSGLAPAIDAPERGRYLYWMTFTPGVIEPAMSEKFNRWQVDRVSCGWGGYDVMIDVLERGLQPGPWLLGERFSAADVLVGSSVCFMKAFKVLPDSEPLAAYADCCAARPGYARAMARETEGDA